MNEKSRVHLLLTTVCKPFGGKGEGDSVSAELFHAQVTRSQGIFSFRQHIRCWGLDYIAENISVPTVVLHYPSERELVRELKRRHFDYIGINFVVATFHKVQKMTRLIRKHAPESKIILGGYGTVLSDDILNPHADYICREEGIGFMHRLLKEPSDKPVRHPYAPISPPRAYSVKPGTKVAHITGGLGCPNGCDFCCTSHFFNRKYIRFIETGRDLFDTMRSMVRKGREIGDNVTAFILIDEDFFIHERRAREFLHCVREEGETFSIMGFGSIRGLSNFAADEIAEMGFDTVWTAYEGEQSGYEKLQGKKIEVLYKELHSRGVALLSSMIIGFPYQDQVMLEKEVERFIGLEPDLWQILIYFAFPGTPLFRKAMAEDRYLPEFLHHPDHRKFDGFSMHFKHPHFAPDELETLQKKYYRRCFERLGPSLVRVLRTWFNGYRNLKQSANPLLRAHSERLGRYVRESMPGIYPAILFGPNRVQREAARGLLRAVEKEFGPFSIRDKLLCWSTIPLSAWTWIADKLDIFLQPRLLRITHRL